eukprot:Skav227920  [mRNA]  locus=scaffold146:167034:177005:- [translate_table: standard]
MIKAWTWGAEYVLKLTNPAAQEIADILDHRRCRRRHLVKVFGIQSGGHILFQLREFDDRQPFLLHLRTHTHADVG